MKTAIRKLIHSMGYDVTRLWPKGDKGKLRFGPYEVESHSAHQLAGYARHPGLNQALGRLAACLEDSDSELGIIDVGANNGDTAALIRSHTALPILCIEGDPKLYALLQKNASQCPDVTLLNCYVGETTGSVPVRIEKEGWNNTLVPAENSPTVLQIVRLDELSDPGLTKRKVGLLKVDAEGFDIAILFGARNLLATSRPVIAFEYNRDNMDAIGEPGLRVFPYLDGLGYEGLLIYDDPGRYLMSATVQDMDLLRELHEFLRPPKAGIWYFDFVAFPSAQRDIFQKFRESERFGGDKDQLQFAEVSFDRTPSSGTRI